MIIGAAVVDRILSILPPEVVKTTFVLNTRLPRETGYTAVPWGNARRYSKGIDKSEILMAGALNGEEWHWFELFKTVETVDPKIGDSITDDNGDTWQVKKIDVSMMELIFKCLCLKNK